LPLTRVMRSVPLGPLAAALAPLALATDNPLDRFNVNPRNVNVALYRRMTAVGFHPIAPGVLRGLAGAFREGGLCLPDGSACVRLLPTSVPVLSLSGTVDLQCSPTAARRHGTDHEVFGRVHGQAEDYGHFDMIMGTRARHEVWPTLSQWLRDHG
jgi:hypothetical protein